jgi:epoxyqueuosine reductase
MDSTEKRNISFLIRKKACELGFDICGIAETRALTERGAVLKSWCEAGMSGDMGYLNRDIEKRLNPELLVPGARSLIVTGLSYYTTLKQKDPAAPVLSRYAYGINYHDVIGEKLEKLREYVITIAPESEGRIFVDSGPLLEKAWAQEAGLGWQGRHSVVINKKIGSFFFIGILILKINLEYDKPFDGEYCGDCRLCIEECPAGAINDNRTIDARKCIANLTIENRGPIPEEIIPKLEGRVYGCDKCQEVCPWNKQVETNKHPQFEISEEVAAMSAEEWQSLSKERFIKLFKKSAIGRVRYENMMRNISASIKSIDERKHYL